MAFLDNPNMDGTLEQTYVCDEQGDSAGAVQMTPVAQNGPTNEIEDSQASTSHPSNGRAVDAGKAFC